MKKIIIAITLILLSSSIVGQYRPLENIPTPVAANLGRYGDYNINHSTGSPDIEVPIHEIKNGDISVPISFFYSLSSVKPNVKSGWTGLGWNLSAGGSISRKVRGCYDEKQNVNGESMGFYYNYQKLKTVHNVDGLNSHRDNYRGYNQNNQQVTPYELTSDEYVFNFCNYSGRFYLDENGKWVVVSDQDIRVEFEPDKGFRYLNKLRSNIRTNLWHMKSSNNRFFDLFTLITPDGFRYTFGGIDATEYSISYYDRNNKDLIPTSWLLTKIESPKGYKINFEYEAGSPTCELGFSAFSSQYYQTLDGGSGIFLDKFLAPKGTLINYVNNTRGRQKLSGYLLFPVYLKKIYSENETVEFHSRNETFSEKETRPHEDFMAWEDNSVSFTSAFNKSQDVPSNQFHVFMPDNNITKIQKEYISWRLLNAITIIPTSNQRNAKTYYLEYRYNKRRKLSHIAERKGVYEKLFTLEKGGYWEGGKEHHIMFESYYTPPAIGYSSKSYSFNYNSEYTFPRYIFASTDHWGYYNGRGTNGESSLSKTILFDEEYYQSREPAAILDKAKAETLKEIIFPTKGKAVFEYKQNQYNKIVPESLTGPLISKTGSAGGLCVSEIKLYDADDKVLNTKKYYYTHDMDNIGSSSYRSTGILNAEKKYVLNYNVNGQATLSIFSEGGFLEEGLNSDGKFISYPHVIEESIDNNGRSNGYIRYNFSNYGTDIWGNIHADIPYSYANIQGVNHKTPFSSKSVERGKLLQKEYFNADKKLLKSIEYKYNKILVDSIKMPYQEQLILYSGVISSEAYIAYMTYIYTYRYFIHSTVGKDFDPKNGQMLMSSEKKNEYNNNKLLRLETIKGNMGDEHKKDYKYSSDFINEEPYKTMVSKNIKTPIIETSTYINNNLLKKENTSYKMFQNGIILPQKEITQIKANNPELRIQYHNYDQYGNPLYITKDDATHVVYLWSYSGQYPIAEIKNATYTQVETILSKHNLQIENLSGMTVQALNEYRNFPNMIQALRTGLPVSSQITTYTYRVPFGIATITDSSGKTTYYDYDDFGRLSRTYIKEKDSDNNEIEKSIQSYDYNYR